MGIRFACPACGHVLNVKSDLAGKRGICPKCQARVDIPLESTVVRPAAGSSPSPLSAAESAVSTRASQTPSAVLPDKGADDAGASWVPAARPVVPAAAPPSTTPLSAAALGPAAMPVVPLMAPAAADPIAEAPHLLWYVAPPGSSNQYGPASGEMFRAWIHEGRVAADSMVWRQDWSAWSRAGDVLPQLGHSSPVVSLVPTDGPGAPVGGPAPNPIAAGGGEWSPARPAGAQPMVAGALDPLQKRRPSVSSTAVVVVLAILMLVLIPVLWLVLRH
ncbi:MAG TPA: DUF4339 domain-containing protein [Pirellulales bacterium]